MSDCRAPDLSPQAIERARVVGWLLAFRERARRKLTPDQADIAQAVLGVVVERLAAGEHELIPVEELFGARLH